MPERAVAEALVEALRDVPVSRALIARAEEARDVLPDALRERGAEVDVARALPHGRRAARRRDARGARDADYVTFTSASSVRSFLAAAGGRPPAPRIVSIGPATSAALREAGVEPRRRGRRSTRPTASSTRCSPTPRASDDRPAG